LPYLSDMSTSPEAGAAPNGWILYDGACGFCSYWVPRFSVTLKRLGLGIAPLQSAWVEERTGLAPDVLSADLRLLHPDGRITSGPDVYRYVMRRVWWAYPLFLLSRLPLLDRVFNRSYRVFARHRVQISSRCGLVPPSSEIGR
jgi:predicted DCC family thiol-disulfide oxidoreductase YuxK